MFNLHFDGHPRLYDPHENVPRAKNEASPIKHFSHLKKRQGDPMGSLKKLVTGWKQANLRCHISDLCFRHETPVLSKPIEVVHLSEELVVLDKPCSLPVSLYFNLSCDKKGKVDVMMRFVCFFHVCQPPPPIWSWKGNLCPGTSLGCWPFVEWSVLNCREKPGQA